MKTIKLTQEEVEALISLLDIEISKEDDPAIEEVWQKILKKLETKGYE